MVPVNTLGSEPWCEMILSLIVTNTHYIVTSDSKSNRRVCSYYRKQYSNACSCGGGGARYNSSELPLPLQQYVYVPDLLAGT